MCKNGNKIQEKSMICPDCNSAEMIKEPLQEAIEKGLVQTDKDIDVSQSLMDELIESSEYAICPKCEFKMIPAAEKIT
jgi:DNA-directed RNA polymerase subunit RPC12/RpoP